MIEAQALTIAYGDRIAVDAAGFRAAPGELVALAGPNGSGKSSLLGALNGEIRPVSGRALIDGGAVAGVSPRELARLRAALEQSPSVSARFTVRALIALGVMREIPPDDAVSIVRDALAAVGLSDRGFDRVARLSGGQQRRAHLGRALAQLAAGRRIGGGRALLLDEPTAGLDAAHQIGVLRAARAAAESGAAVVVAVHDLSLAAAFADRIVLMRAGRIVADAPPLAALTPSRLSAVYETEMSVFFSPTGGMIVSPAYAPPSRTQTQQGASPCSSP